MKKQGTKIKGFSKHIKTRKLNFVLRDDQEILKILTLMLFRNAETNLFEECKLPSFKVLPAFLQRENISKDLDFILVNHHCSIFSTLWPFAHFWSQLISM